MKRASTSMLKIVIYIIIISLIVALGFAILMAVRGAGTSGFFQNVMGGKIS